MKFLGFAASLLLASAAGAFPYPATPTFTDAKTGFIVRVGEKAGQMVLDGRHPQSRETFHLVVSPDGKVRGTWASQPVDYVMSAGALAF